MLDTNRAKKLEAYINTHPNQKVKNRMMDIAYGGTINSHDIYRIPVQYLIHNIRNGRFRSELLEKEEQLKRKLNATKKADKIIIRDLLLELNHSETKALEKDISKKGQLYPGIITFDGAVINANRRMAVLHKLHEETGDDKYKYLMGGILPKGIEEVDLWKIEAGIQFGRDFKLDYGGVNELLKLREGAKTGLSAMDISNALLGRFTKIEVEEKLDNDINLEKEQLNNLKSKQYASHCQLCLCERKPSDLAPKNSYVEWEEVRRSIVHGHHVDPKSGDGVRHVGNIILLCKLHHENYGRRLTRDNITAALHSNTRSSNISFDIEDECKSSVNGYEIEVMITDSGEIIKLFFTKEHRDYWLSESPLT